LDSIDAVGLACSQQSAQIENACVTVAKNFLLTDNLNVGIVQSFPQLNPPGVRMNYALRQGTAKSEMSDTFACEFQSAEPPFDLTRFCVSTICYAPDDSDADRRRRFGRCESCWIARRRTRV
jgi:hypothetical protein